MITDVAVVVSQAGGAPIPGAIVYMLSPDVPQGFLFAITNDQGYALWQKVNVPFAGTLQIAGAAAPYGPNGGGEPVMVPAVNNATIRVGPSPANPQDPPQLPPAVPTFKLPSTGLRDWRGAFVIPDALPGIPGGDNARIWTPAFGIYSSDWQDKILTEFVDKRGYKMFPYDPAGWIYHTDYGYLPDDSERVRRDLMKIYRRGAVPVVFACNDADGGSVEPYQSVKDNADLIKIGSFMWEVNGPLGLADYNGDGTFSGRIVDCMNNCLAAVPGADWYWHFTAGHGSIGVPEREGWKFSRSRGVVGLLSQDDGYNRAGDGDPIGTAAGTQDTAERLAQVGCINVQFEQSTTPVYHKWPSWNEDKQRRYGQQIHILAPAVAGYCDGSY